MSTMTATATKQRILFVDDEENIRKAIGRLFLDEPFDVHTAASGREALALLSRDRNFSVIVSDQRMPEMNGAEFLAKARELAPDTVRIVLTGYADVSAAIDAINKGGAYRYISKPWNDEDLIGVVRDAASRHALVTENKRLTEIVHRQNAELQRWNSQLEMYVQEQTIEISKKNEALGRSNERLRKNFSDTIGALGSLLELRDPSSMNHARNVADVAMGAARDLGLPSEDADNILVASLLHDIGKIGMADVLLVKDVGDMTPQELRDYRQHAVRGQTAIDGIEDLRKAGVLIRHHHEEYSGAGFPDRLAGDQIPLGSRIIHAADLFDRSFARLRDAKAPNPIDQAWKTIKQEAGKKLDPRICLVLERAVRAKYTSLAPQPGTRERELAFKDLAPGMIVTRDVISGTGILLLSKGAELNSKNIQALQRYEQVDPLGGGVFVKV